MYATSSRICCSLSHFLRWHRMSAAASRISPHFTPFGAGRFCVCAVLPREPESEPGADSSGWSSQLKSSGGPASSQGGGRTDAWTGLRLKSCGLTLLAGEICVVKQPRAFHPQSSSWSGDECSCCGVAGPLRQIYSCRAARHKVVPICHSLLSGLSLCYRHHLFLTLFV